MLGDAQSSHLGTRHLHIDGLALLTEKGHFLHILYGQQFTFEQLGNVFHLGKGEAFTGQTEVNTEHVAEIIIDYRRPCSGGQLRGDIENLASQFIPYSGQGVLVILILDLDLDCGKASGRVGFHPLELPQFLDCLFNLFRDLFLHLFR